MEKARSEADWNTIKALGICSVWVTDASGNNHKDCLSCPYRDENDPAGMNCGERLMADAKNLIIEQDAKIHEFRMRINALLMEIGDEPRVLSLKEIPDADGAVFIEHRGVDYIESCVWRYEQQPFYRFAGKDHAFGLDLSTAMYEEDWRAWDKRPTEEERKAVAWK